MALMPIHDDSKIVVKGFVVIVFQTIRGKGGRCVWTARKPITTIVFASNSHTRDSKEFYVCLG